jgi:hypothetical protein
MNTRIAVVLLGCALLYPITLCAMEKNVLEQQSLGIDCSVCFEKIGPSQYVVVKPCGHVQTCSECVKKISLCPICTKNIQEVIKIYGMDEILLELHEQIGKLQMENGRLLLEIGPLKTENGQLNIEIGQLKIIDGRLRIEIEQLKGQVERAKVLEVQLKDENQRHKSENARLIADNGQLKIEDGKQKTGVRKLQDEVWQAKVAEGRLKDENQRHKSETARLIVDNAQLKIEDRKQKTEIRKLQDEAWQTKAAQGRLKDENQQHKSENVRLNAEIAMLRSTTDRAFAAIAETEEFLNTVRGENEAARKSFLALRLECDRLQVDLDRATKDTQSRKFLQNLHGVRESLLSQFNFVDRDEKIKVMVALSCVVLLNLVIAYFSLHDYFTQPGCCPSWRDYV